jgi:hypothetical protein
MEGVSYYLPREVGHEIVFGIALASFKNGSGLFLSKEEESD